MLDDVISKRYQTIITIQLSRGAVAQLGERVLCKHQVVGSIPSSSTNLKVRERKMAVPKSKITKSKRGMRRAHDALKHDTFVENKDTGELHRPHHLDLKTGMYNGRQVLNIKTKN